MAANPDDMNIDPHEDEFEEDELQQQQQQQQPQLPPQPQQPAPQQPAPQAPAAARVVKPTPLGQQYTKDKDWEEFNRRAKLHMRAYGISHPQDVELLVLSFDDDTSRHLHQRTHPVDPSTLPWDDIDAIMKVGPFLASKSQFHLRQQLREMQFFGKNFNEHIKKYNTVLQGCLSYKFPMSPVDQCDMFRQTLPPSVQSKCFTTVNGGQWDDLQALQEYTGQYVHSQLAQDPAAFPKWSRYQSKEPAAKQPPQKKHKAEHATKQQNKSHKSGSSSSKPKQDYQRPSKPPSVCRVCKDKLKKDLWHWSDQCPLQKSSSAGQSEPLCQLPDNSSATTVLPALPACAAIHGQPLSAASQWPENVFSAMDTVVAAPSRAVPNDNVFANSTITSDAALSMPAPVLKFSALSAFPELLQSPAVSASSLQLPTAARSLLHATACHAASPAVLTSIPLPPLQGSSDAGTPPAMETQSTPTVSSPTKPSESPSAFQKNFRPPTGTFCKPGFSEIPGQLGGTYAPWIPPHLPSGNLGEGAGSGSVRRVCPPSDLMAGAVIALPIPAVSVSADLSLSVPQSEPEDPEVGTGGVAMGSVGAATPVVGVEGGAAVPPDGPSAGNTGVTESSRITPNSHLPRGPASRTPLVGPCTPVVASTSYVNALQKKHHVHPDAVLSKPLYSRLSQTHSIRCTREAYSLSNLLGLPNTTLPSTEFEFLQLDLTSEVVLMQPPPALLDSYIEHYEAQKAVCNGQITICESQ
jgi:hypothetical protein